MATTKVINDLIDLNQTGNTTALKGCVGTTAEIPISSSIDVEYLVVAGGGGGGWVGGGGGAGGLLTNYGGTKLSTATNSNVDVIIGIAGLASTNGTSSGGTYGNVGGNGGNSTFSTIISTGGGGGGSYPSTAAASGGSGGGGASSGVFLSGASASPSGQGNAGGNNVAAGPGYGAGGGGGAGAVGITGTSTTGGNGGVGLQNNITGTNTYYAGGGGGAVQDPNNNPPTAVAGTGGLGGGANGSNNGAVPPIPASSNTGGGGGGGGTSKNGTGNWIYGNGSNGGSGIVTLRYPTANTLTSSAGLLGNYSTGTTSILNYPVTATTLYQFENNLNSTDSSSYNGSTTNSPTYNAGKFGQCVDFTSNSNNITTSQITTTATTSVSVWLNPDASTSANRQRIISINTSSTGGAAGYAGTLELMYRASDKQFQARVGSAGVSYINVLTYNSNSSEFIDTAWNHVSITRNDTTGVTVLYINGNQVDTETVARTAVAGPVTSIGCYVGGSPTLFVWIGSIDQLRIFPTELTQAQVTTLYAETTTPTTGTIGTDTWSQFIGGTGTVSFSSDSGPQEGLLRTNTDLTSNGSASAMQFYKASSPSGWVTLTNTANSTLGTCNYPITATALYQFEDNANDTCNNYNGTAGANITYPTGNFGKAANFPGNLNTPADGIVLPSSLSTILNNNFSMSFWFNADTFATGCNSGCGNYPTLFAGFEDMKMYFCVYGSGSTYKLLYYNYGAATSLTSTTNLSTSTWYNAVLTQSSTGGAKIYLQGNLDGSNSGITANGPATGTASGQNLFGGYNSSGSFDLPWNGLMDQIRIFPSVLTPGQVTLLFNET